MVVKTEKKRGMVRLIDRTAARLREEIRVGKYAVGQRLADEHTLANEYGVSRGTLRQALKILGDERLLIRHQGRGTFVSNPAYSNVKDSTTALLGILVYHKDFFGRVVQGGANQAAKRGYMLITGSNFTQEDEDRHTDAFLKNSIRGVIISPRSDDSSDNYDRLVENGIPVVMLDTILPDHQDDFVGVDDYRGTYMATRHLIDLGHRRLGYVGHNNRADIPCRLNRLRGFLDACEEAEIDVPPEWRLACDGGHYRPETVEAFLKQKNRPTGLVTFSDDWAIRVLDAAKRVGLKAPDELSVVGFDDSSVGQNYEIPLTSVRPEFEEIGRAIVDLLIDRIESGSAGPKRTITIAPQLVVRSSTVAAPGERT